MEKKSYEKKENYVHNISIEERAGHLYVVLLEEFKEYVADKTVLHVGCNSGSTTYYINKLKPKKLIGLDVNSRALREASKINMGVLFITANMVDMPLADNSIDTIVAFAVFEHLYQEDKEKVIKELKRVLKKDGVILLQLPRAVSGSSDELTKQNAFDICHESFYYTKEDVLNEFKGFEYVSLWNETRRNPGNQAQHNSWVGVFKCVK